MNRTIVLFKDYSGMNIQASVEATVSEIGKGKITVEHVRWAINSQIAVFFNGILEPLTDKQVNRALAEIARRGFLPLTSQGHGNYRYGKTIKTTLV